MDYEGAKAKFLWNLTHIEPEASEVYTDDALLEFPQSDERFRGKENFTHLTGRIPDGDVFLNSLMRGEGNSWIAEGQAGYEER